MGKAVKAVEAVIRSALLPSEWRSAKTGNVVGDLEDPSGAYPETTGLIENGRPALCDREVPAARPHEPDRG
jgi:hypothetical protein